MKATTLALAALLATAGCSHNYPTDRPYPQDDRGYRNGGARQEGWPGREGGYSAAARALELRQELRLDGRQIQRLDDIQRAYADRNRAILSRRDRNDRDMQRLQQNRDRERNDVDRVLSPEQRDILQRSWGR